MSTPLHDREFLKALHKQNIRTLYARIIALNELEAPIEVIEGKVTGGSINVDGASAIRRTCSLTLVADSGS
jgi:hypothetical protein